MTDEPDADGYRKDVILKELDDFGINEASLFPEVDKVAEYLKDRYNAK